MGSFLNFVQTVGKGGAWLNGDNDSVSTLLAVGAFRFIANEVGVQDTMAGGLSKEFAAITDEVTGGDFEFDTDVAADGGHVLHVGFAMVHGGDDSAGVLFGNGNGDEFPWFVSLVVYFFDDNLRAGNGEFVAFAAHSFDED